MSLNIHHDASGAAYVDVGLGARGFARVKLTGTSEVRMELRSPDGGLWSATELALTALGDVLAASTALVNAKLSGSASAKYSDVSLGDRGFARVALTKASEVRIELRSPEGGLWSATELPFTAIGDVLAAATALVSERLTRAGANDRRQTEARAERATGTQRVIKREPPAQRSTARPAARPTDARAQAPQKGGSDAPRRSNGKPLEKTQRTDKRSKAPRRDEDRPRRDFFKTTIPGPAIAPPESKEDLIEMESISDPAPRTPAPQPARVAAPVQKTVTTAERAIESGSVAFVPTIPVAQEPPIAPTLPAPVAPTPVPPPAATAVAAASPPAPVFSAAPAAAPVAVPTQATVTPPPPAPTHIKEESEVDRYAAAEAAAEKAVVHAGPWVKCTFCESRVIRAQIPSEDKRIEQRPDGALWTVTCYHCGTVLTLKDEDWLPE